MRGLPIIVMLLASCGERAAPDAPPVATAPRLVVLLVIDQWPEWSFEAKRAEFHAGGFERLLSEGTWHVGRHPSAVTLTAPGHSLLGTGQPTAMSGIVANEWWHRDVGRTLQSVEAADGTPTPKWLRVAALGDAVAGSGGRAVSVSLKDRAAILPLGHHGTAIWYHPKTVDWTSNMHPPWLDEWNRSAPIALHLHDVWEPVDRERIRALSKRRDFQIGEVGEKGFGATFPHAIDATRNPAEAIFATPLGNQLVLETAIAAVRGEKLGADDVPDLLVVSLSAHDYIAHGWGHESWETWDGEVRLDAQIASFLTSLDREVGAGRWAMIVTSDHGGSRLPELSGGGRLRYSQIAERANAAASTVLGPGHWIAEAKQPTLFLSEEARAIKPELRDRAITRIVEALQASPGIERAVRTDALAGHCDHRAAADRPICLAIDPERSGEVFYVPAANWVFEDEDELMAASHGSPHDYDQLVPVIELPFGRTTHTPSTTPDHEMAMTEIADLIARWLGVPRPRDLPPPPPESGWLQ